MVTLMEALVAERSKRNQDAADAATRQQIGLAVLQALAQKLNAEPIAGWAFVLDQHRVHISCVEAGVRVQVGSWTPDDEMRLTLGAQTTEWITAESCARVIDEAIEITAKLIVDTETAWASAREEAASPQTSKYR